MAKGQKQTLALLETSDHVSKQPELSLKDRNEESKPLEEVESAADVLTPQSGQRSIPGLSELLPGSKFWSVGEKETASLMDGQGQREGGSD